MVGVDASKGLLTAPRVALGAIGETAFRDASVEASLDGKPPDEKTARGFAEACAEAVARSIPSRYSLPYKRHAALGLAYDAWNALGLSRACEPIWD